MENLFAGKILRKEYAAAIFRLTFELVNLFYYKHTGTNSPLFLLFNSSNH